MQRALGKAIRRIGKSSDGRDHVCSDAAFNEAASKSLRKCFSHLLRGHFDEGRIASLDFVSQRGTFTVSDRDIMGRRASAYVIPCLD